MRFTSRFATVILAIIALALVSAEPVRVEPKAETFELPPGNYTALVFTGIGSPTARHATATIKAGSANDVTVVISAGVTLVVPFEGGWKIEKRIDIVLQGSAGSDPTIPGVWAINSQGPLRLRSK